MNKKIDYLLFVVLVIGVFWLIYSLRVSCPEVINLMPCACIDDSCNNCPSSNVPWYCYGRTEIVR